MAAHDAAMGAAAEAIDGPGSAYLLQRGHIDLDDVRTIVAAAAPILLAAERTRIAAAIQADANFEPGCEHDIGFYDGLMRAARLAETAPEPCLCAGHYMACDEPCPDFWLPDVPMSPDKGHDETAPEEGQ